MTHLPTPRPLRLLVALLFAVGLLTLAACGKPAQAIPDATRPAPADLTTPEYAVRSYLTWTSFAYRMANSDLASATVEPTESVRVDSYIELNRQQGDRAIDQHLAEFVVTGQSAEGSRATVATSETWDYRYFSLKTRRYTTPRYTTSYEATYTLVQGSMGWRVDSVEAEALDEVH